MFQMISKGISHKDFSLGFQNYEVFFFFLIFTTPKPLFFKEKIFEKSGKNILSLFKTPKPLFSNEFFFKQSEKTFFRCLEL